jgi:hypothetical protein
MSRKFQRLAIITSILMVLAGYLYYVLNSEGVAQTNRIRLLRVSIKIVRFVINTKNVFYLHLHLSDLYKV